MEMVPIFFILGLLSGLLSGLLGIGGGVITVPAIYYILLWSRYPQSSIMQIAVATSLAAVFITTLAATWAHYRKGKTLQYQVLGFLIPGLIIGCISGAELAYLVSGILLREIFGILAILIGCYFWIPKLPIPKFGSKPNSLLTFFGLLIGFLSSLLGVGGGIFTVPLLLSYNISAQATVATCAVSTLTTSLIGTITYLIMATENSSTQLSLGYIDFPIFISIAIGSLCTTALGVKLSHTLPAPLIKRIFGVVMSLTGLVMVLT